MAGILSDVKDYVGLQETDTAFDSELLMGINAVMFVLNQYGVGPEEPFIATSASTWEDFVGDDPVGGIKEYVNMRVKLLFDPPSNTYLAQALNEQIKEFEWRISVEADSKEVENA